MFNGEVKLINKKSSKVTHAGIIMNGMLVTACSFIWNVNQKESDGEASEVTCKRCQKILERASEGE